MAVSESPRIVGIRINGSPDLVFIDDAGFDVQVGQAVSVQAPEGTRLGRVVVGSGQLVELPESFAEGVSGVLDRHGDDFTVTLQQLPSAPAPQLGSSVGEPDTVGAETSLNALHREYESGDPRLGSRTETQGRSGLVVGLDRERGVVRVMLASGEISEIELHVKG